MWGAGLNIDKEKSPQYFELYAWNTVFEQEEDNLNKRVTATLTRFSFSIEEFINEIKQSNKFKEQCTRREGFQKDNFSSCRRPQATHTQGIKPQWDDSEGNRKGGLEWQLRGNEGGNR